MYYLIQFFSAVLPVQRRWLQNPERRHVEIYWTLGDTCMHQASSNLEGNNKLMMLLRSPAKKTQMTCRSPILHGHYSCWITPHLVADGFTWNRTLVMHYHKFPNMLGLEKTYKCQLAIGQLPLNWNCCFDSNQTIHGQLENFLPRKFSLAKLPLPGETNGWLTFLTETKFSLVKRCSYENLQRRCLTLRFN